jgi:hypothetical protein
VRELYRQFPFYVPETIKVGAGLAVCIAVAIWMYGRGGHFAMRGKFSRGGSCGLPAASDWPTGVGCDYAESLRYGESERPRLLGST